MIHSVFAFVKPCLAFIGFGKLGLDPVSALFAVILSLSYACLQVSTTFASLGVAEVVEVLW